MVGRLKPQGTLHSSRDLLNICVKMGARWSAQTFRQAGEIPGPEAFLNFYFLKTRFTFSTQTLTAGRMVGSEGGCRGLGECVKCRSERVLGVILAFSNRQWNTLRSSASCLFSTDCGGGVLYLVMFLRPVHTDAGSFAESSFSTSQSSYF